MSDSWRDQWAKVVAKAWTDDDFKSSLMSDPKGTLAGTNVEIWDGFDVEVSEGSSNPKLVLSIPQKPDVSDDELESSVVHPNNCCC